MAYIYKITNKINGKVYIGKTEQSDPSKRFQQHLNGATKTHLENRPLYRAMRKYGVSNFEFEVLEETDEPNQREVFYINQFNSYGDGYNATLGGDGTSYVKHEPIVKLYKEGKSIYEIAEITSNARATISNILKNNGIEVLSDGETTAKILSKPVLQLDSKTLKVIAEFSSIANAERALGKKVGKTHISGVCNNKRQTALGFKWKFKD